MGTNYYAHLNVCSHCERAEVVHIGKSSGGWTFSFHATDSIRSYKDWLVELRRSTTKVYDEYGREVSVEEFIELVENKKNSQYNNAKMILSGNTSMNGGSSFPSYIITQVFLDPEGHSFSEGEFS